MVVWNCLPRKTSVVGLPKGERGSGDAARTQGVSVDPSSLWRAGTVQMPYSGKACRGAAAPTGARQPFASPRRGCCSDARTVSLWLGALEDASDLHTRASGLTD